MHRFRHVVIAASVVALAVTALAAPASAGPGKATIGIVNGIPKSKVDICLNGKELRSGAKYGKAVTKVVRAGSKTVVIRKASPGICTGAKISRKVINMPVGSDFTLVITKKAPKWVKFSNAGLGQIWPVGVDSPGFFLVARHAADLGTVNMRLVQVVSSPITPAADDPWIKGSQYAWPVIGPIPPTVSEYGFAAGRVGKANFVKSVIRPFDKASVRLEYYLLGTWVGNAKIIVWPRPVTAPAP